jgi:hypothetical protein
VIESTMIEAYSVGNSYTRAGSGRAGHRLQRSCRRAACAHEVAPPTSAYAATEPTAATETVTSAIVLKPVTNAWLLAVYIDGLDPAIADEIG